MLEIKGGKIEGGGGVKLGPMDFMVEVEPSVILKQFPYTECLLLYFLPTFLNLSIPRKVYFNVFLSELNPLEVLGVYIPFV